jgi:hypothetical protein
MAAFATNRGFEDDTSHQLGNIETVMAGFLPSISPGVRNARYKEGEYGLMKRANKLLALFLQVQSRF